MNNIKKPPDNHFCTVIIEDNEQKVLMPDGTKIPGVKVSVIKQSVDEFNAGMCTAVLKILANI